MLRYDNLRSAVQRILRGSQREETARFIAFRSHWGYEAEFCNRARGNEKGGVEGEGGFFRRNPGTGRNRHLVPVPVARDYAHLNELLLEASKQDEHRMVGDRSVNVGAAMVMEREHLLPLAKEGFDLAAVRFPTVNSSGCAKVLTNFYSVPVAVGTEVQAKIHAAYVEIWYQGKCVARHERCFQRQQKVLDLNHYLEVLGKKPGALAGSTALEQWRAQGRWPASYDRYWEVLKQREGKQSGTRATLACVPHDRDSAARPAAWSGAVAPSDRGSPPAGLFGRGCGAVSIDRGRTGEEDTGVGGSGFADFL